MKYDYALGMWGNIKRLYTERNKTNNMVYNNKSHTDSYEREATEDFDNMILDYEERLILLEVGE